MHDVSMEKPLEQRSKNHIADECGDEQDKNRNPEIVQGTEIRKAKASTDFGILQAGF
jgi:hypothetical protein